MKPLNSKERSKQVWQFIFIFFALAVVPVALIFFSYYKVPQKLSESERMKLMDYSQFSNTQKFLSKQLSDIDSNLNLLADNNSNQVPEALMAKITMRLEEIKKSDTGVLVSILCQSYENHQKHVDALIKAKQKEKGDKEKIEELDNALQRCKQNSMMPPPY